MSGILIIGSRPFPTTPPLRANVAADYERYDGLDQRQGDTPENAVLTTALGRSYGETPAPGRINAPYTRPNGIAGKVGSVGASPLPVAAAVHRDPREMRSTRVSQLTTQYRHGPGAKPGGLAQTIAMTEITRNPPQPGDLTSILAGLG